MVGVEEIEGCFKDMEKLTQKVMGEVMDREIK